MKKCLVGRDEIASSYAPPHTGRHWEGPVGDPRSSRTQPDTKARSKTRKALVVAMMTRAFAVRGRQESNP